MSLLCVPFNPAWAGSEAKHDLRAIYRRRKQDNWGAPILDANGMEQWDTTGPLPMRRHHQWTAKGFQYVTLGDEESLKLVAGWLQETTGRPWTDYLQDRRTRSPFSAEKYLAEAQAARDEELETLIALVADHGAEAVTAIKRATNPDWQMPAAVLATVSTEAPAAPEPKRRGRPPRVAVPATSEAA